MRDIRLALRALRRTPGFTGAVVSSLALGFALAAATMAVVNAYLIRSMPYPAADRLYHVVYAPQGRPEPGGMAVLDWSSLQDVVERADGSTLSRFFIGAGADRQEALGLAAASGSLEMLGVRTVFGRSLIPDDYRPESEQVALIGHSLWRSRFAGDPGIVGRSFRANRANLAEPAELFRIVGVLPAGFRYARDQARGGMEFVVPLRSPMQSYMVRLRDGVPVPVAERRITDVARSVASSMPDDWRGVQLESIRARYVAELKPMLMAITIAAGLVLVIVCVNLAVLMLLRALRRQKEMAVRVALGAGRRHIVRILVAEAFLVCGAALAGALVVTTFTLRQLAPIVEARLGRDAPGGTSAIILDSTVLFLMGAMGVCIALTLSFVPLVTPWQRRLGDTLRRSGRTGTDGPVMRRVRSSLITLEVGASLTLLVGCGLMIRSVAHLAGTDLGFETEGIARVRVALPPRTYPDASAFLQFYDRLTERLSERSDMRFASTNFIPLYETPRQAVEAEGALATDMSAGVLAVSSEYFDMFGIDVKEGRAFTPGDRAGSEPVAVVSQTLAQRLWPAGTAIGRRIRTADEPVPGSALTVWRTVVGVASDVRQTFTDQEQRDIYISFLQAPSRYAPLYVRTERAPQFWIDTLRAAVAAIDPDVLVSGDVTGQSSLAREAERQLAGPRFLMSTLTGFALFAGLLAMLGVYGVTGYAVQQREREVAIRMAIGASRGAVIAMFLKSGGLVLAAGIVCGLAGAVAVARILANQLHGVQPIDVPTFAGACALMTTAGLLATYWPARRAANSSPMVTLNEN